MAFTGNYTCNVFVQGLLRGTFNFASGSYYIALYTNSATLNAATTAYTTTGEIVAAGYTAGGQLLVVDTLPPVDGTVGTGYTSFGNATWTGAFQNVRGALIYKPGDNGAVCVLDFGSDKTSVNTFTVQFPNNTAADALLRIN